MKTIDYNEDYNMRILFMGTPDFADASLKALIADGRNVVGVVTNPDKPKGRGHKMMEPPVKQTAVAAGIPVWQPTSLKNGELEEVLRELEPDIICVVAYGKILPAYVLRYPKYGCVNVHGSLLPKYRGAAPIQRAIIDGEEYSGITTMLMSEGLDTGDMLLCEKVQIGEEETSEQLFDRLAPIGGALLLKTIDGLKNNTIKPVAQDNALATYASMIKKEEGLIDWSQDSATICNLVRGMNSWPMAYTYYMGETVKIISAVPGVEETQEKPGTIIGLEKNSGLKVACGDGVVVVQWVQFPGSRKMNIEDYMRGHDIKQGTVFGVDPRS